MSSPIARSASATGFACVLREQSEGVLIVVGRLILLNMRAVCAMRCASGVFLTGEWCGAWLVRDFVFVQSQALLASSTPKLNYKRVFLYMVLLLLS